MNSALDLQVPEEVLERLILAIAFGQNIAGGALLQARVVLHRFNSSCEEKFRQLEQATCSIPDLGLVCDPGPVLIFERVSSAWAVPSIYGLFLGVIISSFHGPSKTWLRSNAFHHDS
jgi:hypothetical protein